MARLITDNVTDYTKAFYDGKWWRSRSTDKSDSEVMNVQYTGGYVSATLDSKCVKTMKPSDCSPQDKVGVHFWMRYKGIEVQQFCFYEIVFCIPANIVLFYRVGFVWVGNLRHARSYGHGTDRIEDILFNQSQRTQIIAQPIRMLETVTTSHSYENDSIYARK